MLFEAGSLAFALQILTKQELQYNIGIQRFTVVCVSGWLIEWRSQQSAIS